MTEQIKPEFIPKTSPDETTASALDFPESSLLARPGIDEAVDHKQLVKLELPQFTDILVSEMSSQGEFRNAFELPDWVSEDPTEEDKFLMKQAAKEFFFDYFSKHRAIPLMNIQTLRLVLPFMKAKDPRWNEVNVSSLHQRESYRQIIIFYNTVRNTLKSSRVREKILKSFEDPSQAAKRLLQSDVKERLISKTKDSTNTVRIPRKRIRGCPRQLQAFTKTEYESELITTHTPALHVQNSQFYKQDSLSMAPSSPSLIEDFDDQPVHVEEQEASFEGEDDEGGMFDSESEDQKMQSRALHPAPPRSGQYQDNRGDTWASQQDGHAQSRSSTKLPSQTHSSAGMKSNASSPFAEIEEAHSEMKAAFTTYQEALKKWNSLIEKYPFLKSPFAGQVKTIKEEEHLV